MKLDQTLLRSFTSRTATLEELESLEKKCVLSKFDADDAFNLGCLVRDTIRKQYPGKAVSIDITLPNKHCLFRATTANGTSFDNDMWIKRKQTTVFRFAHSTFFMGCKKGDKTPEDRFFVDAKEYAFHGGAVPIFCSSLGYPIACLTVSGLKQEEDHLIATMALIEYSNQTAVEKLDLD
ncbi:uncharacterized protein NDAI_0A06840 [Naumovozyma dairenensis CBS 421]|uniref:Uncharacterized protein n=1 Tax=Naumovozyma dairenensis (strain ATCC 10597 / BCRC 20456 / CBS 421 / NBRC 0211 / NRRL Y-12639) TaxID=1071378 RepID=G0W4V0_NAUDC|nr:hypothetical protein NDAI_0A06840 [Naumovozyma dairenensis CBS 421]CCD22838.1 hypothetical protein NDAI_0A06840 [Naumovozyma dairenensis CBS 421]